MTMHPDPFADLPPLPRNHYGLLLHGAAAQVLAALDALPDAAAADDAALSGLLSAYRPELAAPAPLGPAGDTAALAGWWREAIGAWEAQHAPALPLLDLVPGLSAAQRARRIGLLIPALGDEDARFGAAFARLQGPGAPTWPTVQWLGRLLAEGPAVTGLSDPWTICRALVEGGLLRVLDPGAARGLWALRMPPLLLDALRGEAGARPSPGLALTPRGALADLPSLVLPEAFRGELAGAADLLAGGELDTLVLRGGAGEEPEAVAGALARRLGRGLLTVAAGALHGPDPAPVASLALLLRALPLVRAPADGDGPAAACAGSRLGTLPAPCVMAVPRDGSLPSEGRTLVLDLPELDPVLRREVWARALAGVPADLDAIAERFVLSAGHIPAVARAARSAGRQRPETGAVGVPEIRRAAAELNRREIGPYADQLPVAGTWSDLIAGESTRLRLSELTRRCRFRERLTTGLGRGFANSTNRGVRALFSGPSGTGKTLAAKILAAELGLDLYRVDLAAVINKYIGETEKNLKQVLGRAESLDLVLLLDEGDALLGSRTEVRSANDRYANLQTNYLLQRLEHYQGILVVTTNLGDNIDSAFKRRMDVVVPFPAPGPAERLSILALHLPRDHDVGQGFLERAATRCALSGGQVRNAVLYAGLLALDQGVAVSEEHLHTALRSEYGKAGAAFPLEPPLAAGDGEGLADWIEEPPDPLEGYLRALAPFGPGPY